VNGGIALLDDPTTAHTQNDLLSFGVAFERPLSESWAVMAEVAGLAGNQGTPGADARSEARAGVRFGKGCVRWDFALRQGLTDTAGNLGVTGGLAWTIRPRS
jgi:hypothetical protein